LITLNELKKYTISTTESIRNAIKKMDVENVNFLVVINTLDKVMGVFTSGDFRKAVLEGVDISQEVLHIANTDYLYLKYDYTKEDVYKLFEVEMVNYLPVLRDSELVGIIHRNKYFSDAENIKKNNVSDLSVVIMAGGKGARLEPFTKILPKPLIPIGDDPIIKVIMDEFAKYGMNNFYLTVNDKSRMIKAYFYDHMIDNKIDFVDEDKPLGTAGSLKLLEDKLFKPFFVSNCDIIIKENYEEILNFHKEGGYSMTLVGSMRQYSIPYGVCDLEKNGDLKNIREKPEYDFLVNTGMYIIEPSILKNIPVDTYYDMTELIEDTKTRGLKVGVFPVSQNSWIDIGQWAEYKNAISRFEF
jgi:dTDP-glucose pyrophosphorylase